MPPILSQIMADGYFQFLLKFLKFSVVGFSGLLLDFSATWITKEKFGFNKYLSNSLGFSIAATTNYILNRIWTFHSKDPQLVVQYTKFYIISLIGLALNNLVLYLLHGKMNLNFYASKLIAILLVTAWNFLANYFYTFQS